MIKLFEKYKVGVVLGVFREVKNLIKHILDEEDKLTITKGKYITEIEIKKKSIICFKFTLHGGRRIVSPDLTFGHFSQEGKKYEQLEKYIFSKISPYYKSKIGDSTNYSFIYDFKEINKDFGINIEEYEIFKDTERFGL